MFTNRRTRRVLVSVAALGLVASACSDDDSDAGAESATTQGPAATAEAESATPTTVAPADTEAPTSMAPADTEPSASTAAAGGADIVDTAVGAGDFTTLVAAVQAAGLEETLARRGTLHSVRADRRCVRRAARRDRRHTARRPHRGPDRHPHLPRRAG